MHDSSKSVSADYADYTDKVEKEQEQQAGAGRKGSCLPLLLPCSRLSFIYLICGYQTGETSSLTFICAVVVIISRSELKAGLIQQQDFGA
jgi:hypothetical protein